MFIVTLRGRKFRVQHSMCSNVEAFRNGVEHSALEHSMEMAQSPNQARYIKQV